MSERDRVKEWVGFYKASPLNYQMNALIAVYKNDGDKMLEKVLSELGLERSSDLVKDACK